MTKEEFYSRALSFDEVGEQVDIFKKEKIKYEQEIERLNNIINELSKENQELKEKTKLFHKNGVFSLEYDKETLRDMVLEYQEKIDKALEKINDYKIYCKKNKGFTEYTDIEIEAIEPVISKLEDILKEVSE